MCRFYWSSGTMVFNLLSNLNTRWQVNVTFLNHRDFTNRFMKDSEVPVLSIRLKRHLFGNFIAHLGRKSKFNIEVFAFPQVIENITIRSTSKMFVLKLFCAYANVKNPWNKIITLLPISTKKTLLLEQKFNHEGIAWRDCCKNMIIMPTLAKKVIFARKVTRRHKFISMYHALVWSGLPSCSWIGIHKNHNPHYIIKVTFISLFLFRGK